MNAHRVRRIESMWIPSSDGILFGVLWEDGFRVQVEMDRFALVAARETHEQVQAKVRDILGRLWNAVPGSYGESGPMSPSEIDARQLDISRRRASLYEPPALMKLGEAMRPVTLAELRPPRVSAPRALVPREKTDADYLAEGMAEVEALLAGRVS